MNAASRLPQSPDRNALVWAPLTEETARMVVKAMLADSFPESELFKRGRPVEIGASVLSRVTKERSTVYALTGPRFDVEYILECSDVVSGVVEIEGAK